MNKIKRRLIVEAKWVFEEEYHVDVSKYDIEVYKYVDNPEKYEVVLTGQYWANKYLKMTDIYIDKNAVDSEKVEDFILQYTLEIC